MKNKRQAESSFFMIDLPDFIAGKSYVLIGPAGNPSTLTSTDGESSGESSMPRRTTLLYANPRGPCAV